MVGMQDSKLYLENALKEKKKRNYIFNQKENRNIKNTN